MGHHELQAARAEEERRILREELWRQQMDFRGVHQQSLTEMEELRKFQSSTFDTLARRKLIEDQNTILELSGRVQELQNEVNCMNDSKDFQDAERCSCVRSDAKLGCARGSSGSRRLRVPSVDPLTASVDGAGTKMAYAQSAKSAKRVRHTTLCRTILDGLGTLTTH